MILTVAVKTNVRAHNCLEKKVGLVWDGFGKEQIKNLAPDFYPVVLGLDSAECIYSSWLLPETASSDNLQISPSHTPAFLMTRKETRW